MRKENFRKPARDCQEINEARERGGHSFGFPIKDIGNDRDGHGVENDREGHGDNLDHGASLEVGARLTRPERGGGHSAGF